MIGYYVTVKNDVGQTAFLLGPFDTHEEALARVEEGRVLAESVDAWSHFYSFGTTKVEAAKLPVSLATKKGRPRQ